MEEITLDNIEDWFLAIVDHLKRNGWPSRTSDKALMEKVYDEWVAVSPVCKFTHTLDSDLLAEMLRNRMLETHSDESTANCLSALLLMDATIKARDEGYLVRAGNA